VKAANIHKACKGIIVILPTTEAIMTGCSQAFSYQVNIGE
jgi:hypothetical protein